MKYSKAEAKELILQKWRELSPQQRTGDYATTFALQAAKEFPFESANSCAVIRLWLQQEHG